MLEEVGPHERSFFAICQHEPETDEPGAIDLNRVGTVCRVETGLKLSEDNYHVVVHGLRRARLVDLDTSGPFLMATIAPEPAPPPPGAHPAAAVDRTLDALDRLVQASNIDEPPAPLVGDPEHLARTVAGVLDLSGADRQALLEAPAGAGRLELVIAHLEAAIERATQAES